MEEAQLHRLFSRAASGDSSATGRLLRRYEGVVKASIHRSLGPVLRARVDTDDIFQSASLAVVRELPRFRFENETALVGWLTTIARWRVRKAASHHRIAKRDLRRETELPAARGRASEATSPGLGAARSETRERIRHAVARLPQPDRQVVELRSFRGLTFGEIAETAGLADKDAARYVLQRALRRLGDDLGPSLDPGH